VLGHQGVGWQDGGEFAGHYVTLWTWNIVPFQTRILNKAQNLTNCYLTPYCFLILHVTCLVLKVLKEHVFSTGFVTITFKSIIHFCKVRERVLLWSLQLAVSDCALIGGVAVIWTHSLPLSLAAFYTQRQKAAHRGMGLVPSGAALGYKMSLSNWREYQCKILTWLSISICRFLTIQGLANLCWKLTCFSDHWMMW